MNFNFHTDLLKAEKTNEGIFLSGVASTTGVDKQNEAMSDAALKSMVETSGLIPIVTSHNAEAKDTIGEVVSHSIDLEGRYVIKARLEESDPEAVKMWNLVNKGHKLGFSVGGRVLASKPSMNKSAKRVIDKVELDHIMLTRRPVNGETFAVALTKALTLMELEEIKDEVVVDETIAKAGAKHSASTLSALQAIHAAGDDNVKAMVSALIGDVADAVGSSDDAPVNTPDEDEPADSNTEVEMGANTSDGDADDTGNPGEVANPPVAGKSLSPEELDLIKSEITKTIKEELAKSLKPEPKVPEKTLAKVETLSNVAEYSLSEAIRKSLGG